MDLSSITSLLGSSGGSSSSSSAATSSSSSDLLKVSQMLQQAARNYQQNGSATGAIGTTSTTTPSYQTAQQNQAQSLANTAGNLSALQGAVTTPMGPGYKQIAKSQELAPQTTQRAAVEAQPAVSQSSAALAPSTADYLETRRKQAALFNGGAYDGT